MLDAWIIEKLREEVRKRPEPQVVIDVPMVDPEQFEVEVRKEERIITIDILCQSLPYITNYTL